MLSEMLMNSLLKLQKNKVVFAYAGLNIGVSYSCRGTCSGSCSDSCAGDCQQSCSGDCDSGCYGTCEETCHSDCESFDY